MATTRLGSSFASCYLPSPSAPTPRACRSRAKQELAFACRVNMSQALIPREARAQCHTLTLCPLSPPGKQNGRAAMHLPSSSQGRCRGCCLLPWGQARSAPVPSASAPQHHSWYTALHSAELPIYTLLVTPPRHPELSCKEASYCWNHVSCVGAPVGSQVAPSNVVQQPKAGFDPRAQDAKGFCPAKSGCSWDLGPCQPSPLPGQARVVPCLQERGKVMERDKQRHVGPQNRGGAAQPTGQGEAI